jgi:polyisoprenoid-binding protein YceI
MKVKSVFMLSVIAILAMAFTTIKKSEYKVDSTQSKVTWTGKKVTGEHTGNIRISDGTIITDGKKITGGSFNIDMTTITCTDLKDGMDKKLVGHLNSDDFFAVDKHPKAALVIKSAEAQGKDKFLIKGDLTIKGTTHPVEFPAFVKMSKSLVAAKAEIIVDRTKYDIKYRSKNFVENIGDKAIDDNFIMNVDLVAKK